MTNNTSFVYPNNTNEKINTYMPGYGDISISNLPSQPYDYDNSKEATQDNAYVIFLFPEEARRIKEIVAKALDRVDYEGSVIYHEYPDKNDLQEIINEIYQQISNQMAQPNEPNSNMTTTPNLSTPSVMPISPDISSPSTTPRTTISPTPENTSSPSEPVATMQVPTNRPPCRGYNCPPPYYSPSHFPDGRPNWLRQLLESLFFDEMINRRRKYFNKLYR